MNDLINTMVFFVVDSILKIVFILPILVVIMTYLINKLKKVTNNNYFKNNVISTEQAKRVYKDVPKNKLMEFNIEDINVLKDFCYNQFYAFEIAYNNLDYAKMRNLCTEQLYQKYHTGILLNLKIGQKRIIENIEKKSVIIFELDTTIAKQIISAMIEVSYINYTIDKNGKIISGNRETPITEKFEVTFKKEFQKDDISKCPNCGASLTGNQCEYCRTIIKNEEFRIYNIKKIIEE